MIDELCANIKRRIAALQRIERVLLDIEFADLIEHASHKEKAELNSAIIAEDVVKVKEIRFRLKQRDLEHMPMADLRARARQYKVMYYNTETREKLILKIRRFQNAQQSRIDAS